MCLDCAGRMAAANGYPLRLLRFDDVGLAIPIDVIAVRSNGSGCVSPPVQASDLLMVFAALSSDIKCVQCHASIGHEELCTIESMSSSLEDGLTRVLCTSCRPVVFSFSPADNGVISPPASPGRVKSKVRRSPLKRCSNKSQPRGGAVTRRERSRLYGDSSRKAR